MRSRLFSYSIGVTFCFASLVAAGSSCGRLDGGPAEQTEADSSALEQDAARSVPAGELGNLVPGARLDRQQLAALGKLTSASTIGQFCNLPIGTPCEPPINAVVRACGGFTDACDSTGTEDVLPVNVLCLGNVCTAVAGQNQQTIPCTVPTDGNACSTGCGGSFCAPYSNECIETTNRVQNCFFNGFCSNNTCTNQTFVQQVVGTCTRETEGESCNPWPHPQCDFPTSGICTVSGQCACLLGPQ
jgi:hypothetical protein